MLHLLAYNAALGVAAADTQVNAVAEQVFTRSNNRFQIPKDMYLLGAYYGAVSAIRARLNTASLRLRGFPQIYPFERSLLPPNDINMSDWRDNPIFLRAEEDLEVDGSNDLGAATEQTYAILVVCDRVPLNRNINAPDLRWIRATAAITNVAQAWSAPAAFAFQDTLEGGRYNVYGMSVVGANCVAARLIFQDGQWRPGCVANTANGQRSYEMFRGGLGYWGYFNTYSVPQLETLANAAGAITAEIQLLVGKA
jgi:hypothetical protein